MPFHPADFILREFAFPARHRFGADLREVDPRRRVAAPEPTHFCRRQHCVRIEVDLEISAYFFHRPAVSMPALCVATHGPRTPRLANARGHFRRDPPMRDYVINGEAPSASRFLQRDLRGENRPWVSQGDQNLCMREPT